MAGNSNAAATSKLSTTKSIPLNLVTNNATRLKIYENGRVGIGAGITSDNATRVLNLADATAVMRILRVSTNYAPAIELLSRTKAEGPNAAYWDLYAEPSDASFRIRDRVTGSNLDRITINGSGNVGIRTTSPLYKLHVETTNTAIYGRSTGGAYGVLGSSTYTGIYGYGGNYGVYGSIGGNYGVYGTSSYVGVYGSGTSYGFSGTGTASSGSYGAAGTGSYIGVFGSTSNGSSAVVGNSTNGNGGNFYSQTGYALVATTDRSDKNWAAVFNGNVYAYGAYQPSDKSFKKNVKTLENAMSIINQLKPKSYEYLKEGKFAVMNLPLGSQYGLIAQEMEEVLPGLVKEITYVGPVAATMPDSSLSSIKRASPTEPTVAKENLVTKAVNYTGPIPVIIKGMQEQNEQMAAKDKKIEQLEARLQKLEALLLKATNPSSASSAYLEAPVPNPPMVQPPFATACRKAALPHG